MKMKITQERKELKVSRKGNVDEEKDKWLTNITPSQKIALVASVALLGENKPYAARAAITPRRIVSGGPVGCLTG